MEAFILHNYAISPFAEKVRSVLGYLNQDWQSVIVPTLPPRHTLEPIAGNYGRIPVAQIGSDVFCDTKTIFAKLAELHNKPELDFYKLDEEAQRFANESEGDFFFSCVIAAGGLPLIKKSIQATSLSTFLKMTIDRLKMTSKANISVPKPHKASGIIRDMLPKIETRLGGNAFLGGQSPSYVDFTLYHSLWMVHFVGERSFCKKHPMVSAWLERIHAFGNGNVSEIEASVAQQTAKNTEPKAVTSTDNDANIGKKVSIGPADYRLEETDGTLDGKSAHYWILEREHNLTGKVHIHFPQKGYKLKSI